MKRPSKAATLKKFTEKATALYGTAKVTKEQAVESGLTFYWRGVDCIKGHRTYTYTASGSCRQCALEDANHRAYGDEHTGLPTKNNIDDMEYKLELARLNKEYDYDF